MIEIRLENGLSTVPHTPGVYWMKDRFGHVLYVGKAKNLKKRVSSYFQQSRRKRIDQPKIAAMVELAFVLGWYEVRNEPEALLLEGKLIKQWKPKYNTDFTDDKRFLSVRVNLNADIPQFQLVRTRLDDAARYFGPFAQSNALKITLKSLRQRFGIVLGDTQPKRLPDGTYQLYDDFRAEIYGHSHTVSVEEYRQRVQAACQALDSESRLYMKSLEKAMQEASQQQAYEKAAQLRDQLLALKATLAPARRFLKDPKDLKIDFQDGLKRLQEVFHLSALPVMIEGFDISHISGTFTVASLVCFKNGKPLKSHYRHFKIRSHHGNDDFKSMAEVVERRYRRCVAEHKDLPDLILIDGGLGQVHAACQAFAHAGIALPALVGLAKKEETLVLPDGHHIRLPVHDLALRLLQQVRDEAHRFANAYNAQLRLEKMRESVLDHIPGLGEKKKLLLLSHFKSIAAIKAATVEELEAVPQISAHLAWHIHRYLHHSG